MTTTTGLTSTLLVVSYASIVLAHTALQERFRKRNRPVRLDHDTARLPHLWQQPPSVDVVVPTYNERADVLEACCASLARQDYKGQMYFLIVDDGSSNIDQLLPIYRRYQQLPDWTVLLARNGNRGKRAAQDAAIYGAASQEFLRLQQKDSSPDPRAWPGSRADIVLTVDSDTVIEPDGVSWILTPFVDEEVAAVTGDVGVLNRGANQLTGLIHERYRLLSRHERAAQSYFGAVFCCAGPFSAYRRQALNEVWSDYMMRRFGGAVCTFGDDLQLTSLMLERGCRSIYQPQARAYTTVPMTLADYLRQQVRWVRSFYRQFRWIRVFLYRNRIPYQVFDLVARTVPSVLLMAALFVTLMDLVTLERARLAPDLLTVGAMVLVGLTAALRQTRQLGFAIRYGLLYVALLLPAGVWALCTLRNSQWSTRTLSEGEARATAAVIHWIRARCLRALRSPISLPFCR